MSDASQNPYVGPRTFTREEGGRFFGRESEARDLLARVISERLVLFYAQSGAGKSSLINTRLIPQLQASGFGVLPVGRVSGALPGGSNPADNIFVFNLLLSLDQSRGNPQHFNGMTLNHFLARLTSPDGEHYYYQAEHEAETGEYESAPSVLIIDQFEEIITTHLEYWPQRADFFRQLDQAMAADPLLWVVLTLREDYIAALEPYAYLLTDKLRARFYMQRMDYEAALETIEQPARLGGRPFASGVAQMLVDNLRQLRLQPQIIPSNVTSAPIDHSSQPSGVGGLSLGQYVEPVQLQVVCYQLWQNLTEKDPTGFEKLVGSGLEITAADLASLGNVDTALSEFYEQTLRVAGPEVSELILRRWFSNKLITEAGTRGIVFQGPHDTAGLPNAVVKRLADLYLLRAEMRAGGTWYELVHDRFVEPIQQANQKWEAERLQRNPLAAPAAAWQHNPAKLLDGAQLTAAATYVEANPQNVTEVEQEFLTESRNRVQARASQRRLFITLGGVLVTLGGVVMVILALLAWWGWQNSIRAERNAERAEQQAQVSLSRQLAAQSVSSRLDRRLDRALLLSLAAATITNTLEARDSLLNGLLDNPRLQYYLTGHSEAVQSVAFSPDGKTLASGSGDKTIILWDVSQPDTPVRLGQPLTGHSSAVWSVAFSPDGRTLASGSWDNSIILWDVSQPNAPVRLGQPLTGHSGLVQSVAFSPDGRTLASGSWDNSIILWDVSQPDAPVRLGQPLTGHSTYVSNVVFSPDGRILASGSADSSIILWDVSQPDAPVRLGQPLTGHNGAVLNVAFSTDGQTLASGSADSSIILWDVSQPNAPVRHDQPLTGHSGTVWSVAFNPDGQTLASGSEDSSIILWNINQPDAPLRLGQPLTRHSRAVWSVAFSPHGRTLASGSEDNSIILWDVSRLDASEPLTGHSNAIQSVAFSPDGQTLASGSADSSIILWDVSQPDAPVSLGQPLTGHTNIVSSVAFSPDGRTLASGSWDNSVILWDVSRPDAPVHRGQPLTGHSSYVSSVAFSPDGKTLTSGSGDKTIILWDVSQPDAPVRLGQPLTGHSEAVQSVAFSPDGKTLASGSADNSIILWDVSQPDAPVRLGQPLTGHSNAIQSVAFNPDGRILASGSADRSIILWDVSQPDAPVRLGQPLIGHNNTVLSVAFSPDSQTLASGSADSSIILWNLSLESWQMHACRIANRNLTQAEWRRYVGEASYQKVCANLPAGE